MIREEFVHQVNAISDSIVEVIETRPEGFPSGELYALLMGHMTLETYNVLLNNLKAAGRVRESGFLLFPPPKPKPKPR